MEDVLIKEIGRQRAEIAQLQQRLDAKRYHWIDNVVDTVYRGVYLVKPRPAVTPPTQPTIVAQKPSPRKIVKGKVAIINVNFYDWDGKTVYKGGAERYVYDLAKLLCEMGYQPELYQGAHQDFERDYHGFKVYGKKASGDNKRELSRIFNEACRDAEFIIASPDELAAEIHDISCLAINHSIKFDGPSRYTLTQLPDKLVNPYSIILDSITNAKACVCVDTNFINWMRTRDYALSQKLIYIPNYFDQKVFQPSKRKHDQKEVVFVFPRRIEESRGHKLVLEAFRRVVKKYPKAKLQLIGQVQDPEVQKQVDQIIADLPKNVSYTVYEMAVSYKAYQNADVVLAPTTFTDGTSLVCIEGQASGLPVIASNIGGLPNLIIDHYNGLLISPDVDSLTNAMLEFIKHPEMRVTYGKRALEVAKSSFEKKLWEERWREVITDFVQEISQ